MPIRPPYLSVALISASALAYEILLMRLFSIIQWYHFAYLFIGLALLGYGISGTVAAIYQHSLLKRFSLIYIACLALFGLSAVLSFMAAQQLPFNAEEILWDGRQLGYLTAIFLLLAVPFFFAATGVCLALMQFGAQVSRLYAMDLLGAGVGSLGVVLLLLWVFPQQALVVLGVLGVMAAMLASWELHIGRLWPVGAGLMLIVVLLVLGGGALPLQRSPYKSLSQILRISGIQVIDQRSSPLGLISIVQSKEIPIRHAPGLSVNATGEPLPQLGVFTDGDNMTAITRYPDTLDQLSYLGQMTSALPYHLQAIDDVLLIGVGGGSDVLQARYHRSRRIDGVELNPQMIRLVNETYGDFSGRLYQQDGVTIYQGEVRDYLTRTQAQYDLIQLALVDAFNASASGLYALNESYLYTIEALQLYLRHLAPDGYLALTRWIKLPPRDTLKLFATAVDALKRAGVPDPQQRLVLIRSWQTSTLLVKNGGFTPTELAAVKEFSTQRSFDMAYTPQLTRDQVNRYNILKAPVFYQAATALLGDKREEFMRRYKFNLQPATDDRPYFHQFFKWSTFVEIMQLRSKGGMPLFEWGYITLIATLGIAVLLSTVLIMLPLWFYQRRQMPIDTQVHRRHVLYYFFAIGLAFLFIEIAFIQKFILFLHHPVYAIAVTLMAFLVFAGIGSHWSGRLAQTRNRRQVLGFAVTGIAVMGLVYLLLLDPLFTLLVTLPIAVKIVISVLLIAPLAYCMGMPFPLALSSLVQYAKHYIPWAWGINGCASVISAVLATVLAIHFGFRVVIVLALMLYVSAVFMFPGVNNRGQALR